MSIYDKDASSLLLAYDKDGSVIDSAYDIDGSVVYTRTPPLGIKIMSYNVGGWYIGSGSNVPSNMDTTYYNLQNGMLADNDPDILCLQEYWTNFSSTRKAQSLLEQYFPYIQTQNGYSSYFGRAICSKYPITNYTTHTYSNESDRYYDSCTITINDQEYTVVTTHLGLNISNRSQQISELLSFLSNLNKFIVCGDFNTIDCLSSLGADYTVVIRPILNANYNIANCYRDQSTFKVTYSELPNNDTNNLVLDNIITSSDLIIRSVSVDTTKLTDGINEKVDHMPLIAEI